ncbi:hypothetical protein [Streptomyces sp. NPDC057686]|uniref:hypothetical protein n=1 Tax=Streptomyces sp. NPDC057686 TaxID=3346212 RepID=UPI00367FF910
MLIHVGHGTYERVPRAGQHHQECPDPVPFARPGVPACVRRLFQRGLPATEQAGEEILSLPFHQHLTGTDIDRVVTSLEQALKSVGGS